MTSLLGQIDSIRPRGRRLRPRGQRAGCLASSASFLATALSLCAVATLSGLASERAPEAAAGADQSTEGDALFARFEPDPGATAYQFLYTVHYRLLWLDLMNLARARIEIVPGRWTLSESAAAETIDAYWVRFQFDTQERPRGKPGARVVIHDRLEAVLDRATLETRLFRKVYAERINVLGRKKHQEDLDLYEFTTAGVRHVHADHLAGTRTESMLEQSPLRQQASQVSNVLGIIARLSRGESAAATSAGAGETVLRLHMEGRDGAQAFDMLGTPERIGLPRRQGRWQSAKIIARPVELGTGEARDFFLWAVPYAELAPAFGITPQPGASPRQDSGPYALPAIVEFDIGVGAIRCYLTEMTVAPAGELHHSGRAPAE